MIRFSAFLVVAAVGTLVGGVVTSKLLLVYIAIGVSGLALLALGVGAAVNWRELTGKPEIAGAPASTTHADASPADTIQTAGAAQDSTEEPATVPGSSPPPHPTSAPQAVPARVAAPEPSQAPAASSVTGSTTASRAPWSPSVPAAPSRAGYLPTEPWPSPRPAVPRPWERPGPPLPPPGQPPAQEPAAAAAPPDDDASVQEQTLIFRAQDPAPPGREDAVGVSEPEPAASASKPAPAAEPQAAEPQPEPAPEAAAAPVPEADATLITKAAPADASTPAGHAAAAGDREPADDATTLTEPAAPDPDLEVTVVPGVPRYHKSQCILIRFMGDSDLDKMTVAAAREAGCTPCRACLPDQPDGSAE